MKKFLLCLGGLIVTASSPLLAASTKSSKVTDANQQGQMMQGQMMQSPDCSQLSPDEQNFASQIMDSNNKMMFCSKFSSQQRQQAMQMNGQMDSAGNKMTPDQAVQKAMGSTPTMTPSSKPSTGGCPAK